MASVDDLCRLQSCILLPSVCLLIMDWLEKVDDMQKITPFLWFDGNAEEAVNLYVSIFKNSKIVSVARYGEGGPGPKGTLMTATFELDGQKCMAL